MQMRQSHRTALQDLLIWRRDVRHFRPDPVDPACLTRLQRSMEHAPSVGNARPWRVLQVENAQRRAEVIASFDACNAAAAQAYEDAAQRDYLALKLAGLREAPVHLAVFTDLAVAEGRGLGRQTMPETLSYSTVMAIHTLWLAARAENLGLGWVSILDPVEVHRILDAPATWALTGYLCLGHPQTTSDTPLLHQAGWQADTRCTWQVR
ncbi:5,6-dimethylbenzimidazole synthase [uncultured Roseobacter sp.]|uniref:5,6-dimethylbenzimidazole synthase n=1 Tax=uncultured Roseobacter sp. TaxID=114847 RepID=UPI002633A241|nr:5,6-dimethylbenzimidazole synthase [uncultured Roseobacter sp.]